MRKKENSEKVALELKSLTVKMSLCRTCLSDSAEKDIRDMEVNGEANSFNGVLLFCLNIQVAEEEAKYTKLCLECYRNILSFYEFKTLAQKNDVYWRSLEADNKKNLDCMYINEIKCEESKNSFTLSNNNESDMEFNEVLTIKAENVDCDESDDELLSVIKWIKYENTLEDSKENKPGRRKEGRVKKGKKVCEGKSVCEECGKSVRNLKEHMNQHQPKSDRRKLKCKLCDKTFSSASARCKHYKIKHLGIKKRCPICDKEVVSLWSHTLNMHSERRAYKCAVCEQRFGTRTNLAAHVRTHSAARPHQCDQCDKAFGSKIVMIQHRRQVHDKERSHLCQFCSKSFFKKYHLQVHLRSHSKEKPYGCNMCGKFFTSCTTLKNHKLLHSNTKMFECPQCAVAFSTPGYLRNHMVIHAKVKKHACKYCGVKFVRSDHKKRHERTAHENHILATHAFIS